MQVDWTCFCCWDDLSYGLNTLGPLCLWQCYFILPPEFLQLCFDHQLVCDLHIWHWLRIASDRFKLASSTVLSWYHHQPESHQQSFTKSWMYVQRPGPIDRTPETPGSGKNHSLNYLRLNWPQSVKYSSYFLYWTNDWLLGNVFVWS